MRIRGILFTIVVVLALIFAVANWETVTTALPIALLFWSVEAPLGLILLATVVVLTAIFFFASLVERASQLRQVSHLERQIEGLRARLEQKRLEELEGIERAFRERTDKLEGTVKERGDALEAALGERLAEHEMRTKDRIEGVNERVVLVRDELAADVAEAEDLLRRMIEGNRTLPPA
jgi:uncharacterized integral membrane protein